MRQLARTAQAVPSQAGQRERGRVRSCLNAALAPAGAGLLLRLLSLLSLLCLLLHRLLRLLGCRISRPRAGALQAGGKLLLLRRHPA